MTAIERKLGAATGRLYERVAALHHVAKTVGAVAAAGALARILLDVTCGAFHDYRSGRPLPKGDLIETVRAVPPHVALDDQRLAIEKEILAGWYDEDEEEGRRWVAKLAPIPRVRPAPQDLSPEAVELTPREYRVFAWLHRFVTVYARSPAVKEIALGLGIEALAAREVLQLLERKGAAANLGGKCGWYPTRVP